MPLEKTVEIDGYYLFRTLQYIPPHQITYLEWGNPQNNNVVICAHGLTRNAHDFDKLAESLSGDFRVISINYPGRGNSDEFTHGAHYNYFTYIEDTGRLLRTLHIEDAIWVGTSMGGIIGMFHAKQFKALISNDIGPFITSESLNDIKKYTADYPVFPTLDEAKEHLKKMYNAIGLVREEDWDYLTKHTFRLRKDNAYEMNYDPKITQNINVSEQDIDLWFIWKQIPCSILIIHGQESKILTQDTVTQMQKTKATDLFEVADVGHAPSLMTEDQIKHIQDWINKLPGDSNESNKDSTSLFTFVKDVAYLAGRKVIAKISSFLGL